MSEKRFKSPIENALRGCQFWVKLDKNRGYPYWILTPNERVLSFHNRDVCAKFRRNRFKIATVRARTDRQTHTHTHRERDHTSDLIICPMLYAIAMGQIKSILWNFFLREAIPNGAKV